MAAPPIGETFLKRLLVYHLPLFAFVLFALFPFYWMFVTSIKSTRETYNRQANPYIPVTCVATVGDQVRSLQFDGAAVMDNCFYHWRVLLRDTLFIRWLENTLFVAVVSTFISLFAGITAGYALARLKFRGADTLGVLIFITYLVPPTLLFIPLSDFIGDPPVFHISLLNSPWALIVAYPTFLVPFCTWLLTGYFRTIPPELEEQAMVDGATRIQAMVKVILPLALPGLLSAGMFAFTLSANEFLYALIFIYDASNKTVPVGVVSELIKGDVFYWGELMSGALLGSVPVALIYSFFVEHYVAGMTGAVKG
ncbi:MAG TPA: carbohydrate ABC transporter permease [Terriglobales bacterium]|nr:carbohydrate ABC transporter permease [Terriglobales bacterium]